MLTSIIKKIIPPAVALVLLAAAAAPSLALHIESASGDVQAMNPGENWQDARAGLELEEGAKIKTGRGAEALVRWMRGHSVRIEPLSSITFDEAYYSRVTDLERNRISVENGSMLVATKKFRNRDTVFEVKTPTARAGVRGTRFVVRVSDGESSFLVLEGELSIVSENIEIILEQNFQTTVEPGAPPAEPAPIPDSARREYDSETSEMSDSAEEDAAQDENIDSADLETIYDNVVQEVVDDRVQDEIIYETIQPNWGCCD